MLIGIQGGLGTGKTLLLTKYLLNDAFKGYTILSNYKLINIPHKKLVVEELIKNPDDTSDDIQLKNCTIGIDELTVYADCRLSGSKRNVFFSYLVLQSRKRSVDLYYTTQDFSMIDKRVIAHTHIQIMCNSLYNNYGDIIEHFKEYVIFDLRDKSRFTTERYIMDCPKWKKQKELSLKIKVCLLHFFYY